MTLKNTHIISIAHSRFLAWFVGLLFCFCLFIILWGAWVRISHSGDGCGAYWPSCQGEYFIDQKAQDKTWIEWIHRATSGLFGLMVLLLVALAFWKCPSRHPLRKSTLWVLFFTITEALLGACLVLLGLTGSNSSYARILTMHCHLLNSLLLSGSLFICWRLSLGRSYKMYGVRSFFCFKYKQRITTKIACLLFVFFIIAFLGSISALASSLFPSFSLWEGLMADFSSQSSYLVKLRLWHPLLALLIGGGFLIYCLTHVLGCQTQANKKAFFMFSPLLQSPFFLMCLSLALLSGLLNLVLLSPTVLKLTHLLAVYMLQISFLLSLEVPIQRQAYEDKGVNLVH